MAQSENLPIESILLSVSDLTDSRHFYHQILGIEIESETPSSVHFETPGANIQIVEKTLLKSKTGLNAGEIDGQIRQAMIACHMASRSDVDQVCDRIRDRGASVITPPKQYIWNAYAAYFADPDGNVVEVFCWDKGGPLDVVKATDTPQYADMSASRPLTVTSFCLFVTDLAKCLQFYRNSMAMEPTRLNLEDGFANFSGVGSDFSMWRLAWAEETVGFKSSALISPFHGHIVNCRLPDRASVDAQYANMQAAGVEFLAGPDNLGWGRYCAVYSDPQGNLWSIGAKSET